MNLIHKIEWSNWREFAFPSSVVLLAFFIPLIKYGIQIPILLFILSWFFYPKVPFKKVWWPFLVFGGFYIFHLIGMFYTEHVNLGINDLTEKLSLLLFPFFFATAKPINKKFKRYAIITFAIGLAFSVVLSFIISGFSYANSGNIRDFYMSEFSPIFHPSYIAMFINMAIAILLTVITTLKFSKIQLVLLWVLIFFLSLALVFPTSKMGFIIFVFLIGYFLFKWATQKVFFKLNSLLLLLVGITTLVFIKFNPVAQSRVNSAVEFADGEMKPNESHQMESNAARIYAWKATLNEIKKHPFGVGTGDINTVLENHFRENGLEELADKGLNPHNQYLQSAMAIGIPALLWFLFSLLYPFGKIIRTKDWLYAFFLCSLALNLLVESMLEKQSGIVFFSFFNALFFFSASLISKNTDNSKMNFEK